jgi:hypothetical protein
VKLYPDQAKNIKAYKSIFSKLQQMKAAKSNIQIVVAHHFADELNDEDFVEVYGIKKTKTGTKPTHWALDFTPWKEWMGMEIHKSTLKEFNELELIGHCLFEMTFMGFDERTIQKELASLKKTSDELKKMTPEERKKILLLGRIF